ncbi:MAG TPA: DUF4097 family beta strand repeat-containing protein [Bacteroidales bacterium]
MRTRSKLFLIISLCVIPLFLRGQNRQTIPLANPDKPAELFINNVTSNVIISGYDGKEVIIDYQLNSKSDSLYGAYPIKRKVYTSNRVGAGSWKGSGQSSAETIGSGDNDDNISTEGLKKIKDGRLNYELKVNENEIRISNDISFGFYWTAEDSKISGEGPYHKTGVVVPEEKEGRVVVKRTGSKSYWKNSGMFGNSFIIKVPYHSTCKIRTSMGDIKVDDVTGEIEANTMSGSINIQNISGSVVASAAMGKIKVVLKEVKAETPMAFSTMNGPIDVTLPAGIKANFKITPQQGDVYTDFDINQTGLSKVNGGGPEINFRSTFGNIYIRKGK